MSPNLAKSWGQITLSLSLTIGAVSEISLPLVVSTLDGPFFVRSLACNDCLISVSLEPIGIRQAKVRATSRCDYENKNNSPLAVLVAENDFKFLYSNVLLFRCLSEVFLCDEVCIVNRIVSGINSTCQVFYIWLHTLSSYLNLHGK